LTAHAYCELTFKRVPNVSIVAVPLQQFSGFAGVFSISMWLGIAVSPHDLSFHLAGNRYLDFLLHDLPKLLIPLAVTAGMWYMHEGAPAHFNRAVGDDQEDLLHGLHAHLT
jgi:hypothetical protein